MLVLQKAADTAPTNEDDTVLGVGNVYKKPEGRTPGTLDARWGDDPQVSPDGSTANYGTAVREEAHDDRNEMIERLFDSPKGSAQTEQQEMRQLLLNADEGHPHSPMLQRGHEGKIARADMTLTDLVMRTVGHR